MSILSVFTQIFEKLVYEQLISHIDESIKCESLVGSKSKEGHYLEIRSISKLETKSFFPCHCRVCPDVWCYNVDFYEDHSA